MTDFKPTPLWGCVIWQDFIATSTFVFDRCSHRWYKRQLFPKNRLQSLSSLQTLRPSRHSIWMLWSSLLSLLLAMAASFSLSLCRKSKGTTSLTSCGRSTVFSTTSPNLLNSTLRWADKLCLPSVIIILLWCYDTNFYLVFQPVDLDSSQRLAEQVKERGWESKRGFGPGNLLLISSE